MKITTFTGINNVLDESALLIDKYGASAVREASNVDVNMAGKIQRRQGFTAPDARAHSCVWEGDGFQLAVVGGDLVSIVDGVYTTLHADIGTARVWYCNWPDGRTAYTNGTVAGLATADAATIWGVPNPPTLGTPTPIAGDLPAGSYRYALSYVRTSDELEGGLTMLDGAIALSADAGLSFADLPVLEGFTINVYLTHPNGAQFRLAGNTDDDTFSFNDAVEDLIREAMTENVDAAPAGKLAAFWRGCSLLADGDVLWISKYLEPEHFDLEKGFMRFTGELTLVQPVEAGVFVGTTKQLAFLRGGNSGELAFEKAVKASVVLGSGVTLPGRYLKRGDADAGQGECMLAIADGNIIAGYQDGAVAAVTQEVYSSDATEVSATFRLHGDIPQYIAVPVTP